MYRFPCGCAFAVLGPPPRAGALPLLDFDIDGVPDSCPAVWAMLGRGLTKGVFQLESRLGVAWTKKLKPTSIDHLGALGALLRPGPLLAVDEEGVSIAEHYVRRKNGLEAVSYAHPALESILGETYGVMCYQEQTMRIASELAGFDGRAVDALRKSVGKKDVKALFAIRESFLAGCARQGVLDAATAETVWGWIQATGRYQFNKSHSTCYGIRGYKTAYVKAHFPVAFFAAWLRHARHKSDPREEIHELVNDARLFDVPVLPPDLRRPSARVSSDGVEVCFGLADVKGVGDAQCARALDSVGQAEALAGRPVGKFSWWDFLTCWSGHAGRSVWARLLAAGAGRGYGLPRQRMLAELDAWSSLTDNERDWVVRRRADWGCLEDALGALSLPRKRPAPTTTVRVPRKGREGEVALLEAELAAAAPQESDELRAALLAATRPRRVVGPEPAGPFGGCASDARESAVRSQRDTLARPASPHVDEPRWVAWQEDELLGVSLSCAPIDSCDTSAVNCTAREFRSGRAGRVVLGVTVESVRELRTRGGKNPGARMGRACLSDGTALVEAVVFPDAWLQYGSLFVEGNNLIVMGERDRRGEYDSLVVAHAFQAAVGGASL